MFCTFRTFETYRLTQSQEGQIIKVIPYRYSTKVIFKHKEGRCVTFVPYDQKVSRGDFIECSKTGEIDKKGAFNKALLREGISYSLFFGKNDRIVHTETKDSKAIPLLKKNIRKKLSDKLNGTFSPKAAALLKALYFGNKNYLSKRTIRDFKNSGLMHMLAASGMHVGIVAGLLYAILGLIGVNRIANMAACSLLLCGYLMISDMPTSLLRACLMFWIFSFFYSFRLGRTGLNILLISGICILLVKPAELGGLAFQLSFSATLGILLFYQQFRTILPRLPFKISDSLAVSIAAQLPVIPIIFFSLGEMNLTSTFTTLLTLPLFTLIIYLSFAALALAATPLPNIGAASVNRLYPLLSGITSFFSNLKLHSHEKLYLLLVLFLFINVSVLFIPKFKRIKQFLLVLFLFLGPLSIGLSNTVEKSVCIKSERSPYLRIYKDGSTLFVTGTIEKEDTDQVIQTISRITPEKLYLVITHHRGAAEYAKIISTVPVEACIICTKARGRTTKKTETRAKRDSVNVIYASLENFELINKKLDHKILITYNHSKIGFNHFLITNSKIKNLQDF